LDDLRLCEFQQSSLSAVLRSGNASRLVTTAADWRTGRAGPRDPIVDPAPGASEDHRPVGNIDRDRSEIHRRHPEHRAGRTKSVGSRSSSLRRSGQIAATLNKHTYGKELSAGRTTPWIRISFARLGRAAHFGWTMKLLIATILATALTIGQAAAAHSQRARQPNVEHRAGGPYESLSQGHQSYTNPDRLPYVTQFDEPPE